MLRSICVSVRHFPLMALMACYLSKPVFKCPLMAFHMRHPATLCAALFLSQLHSVEVFFSRLFLPRQVPVISGNVWRLMGAAWLQMYWETYAAELIECFRRERKPIWSCHRDAWAVRFCCWWGDWGKKNDDKRIGKIDNIAVDLRVRSKQPFAVMCWFVRSSASSLFSL